MMMISIMILMIRIAGRRGASIFLAVNPKRGTRFSKHNTVGTIYLSHTPHSFTRKKEKKDDSLISRFIIIP